MSKKCTAKTNNGERCSAWALKGKAKCALHSDPELAAKMGAMHGRGMQPDHDTALSPPPKTAVEIRDALATAMAQVQAHKMDTKTANALAYVGTSLLRAIEVSNLENRLKDIQAQLESCGDDINGKPQRILMVIHKQTAAVPFRS